MDKTFQEYQRIGIDLSPVGVERREENTPYFCTPKGAVVFGWAGVDGIHFCFIRGFGNMVFAISPMNASPNYVHPLARNFADFLRLLLACGDAAALEQAWMWDETQWETFRRDNPPSPEQQARLSEVAAKMKLTPMAHPWSYVKELQASFDSGKIKYSEDYYTVIDMTPSAEPAAPEWKVYFDGSFRGHRGKARAGTEIRLDSSFDWAGYHWLVPAAYSCSQGLIVDFCMWVDAEDICRFMKKWNLSPENDSVENFTPEQQLQIDLENPLVMDFIPGLEMNGKTMPISHGCAVSFNPCLPDLKANNAEAQWVIDHYGLPTSYGWVIQRNAFPWPGKRRPAIQSLSLTMEPQPCRVPGPHFRVHAPGDSFTFSHPVSGAEYTLTVQTIRQQTLPQNYFGSNSRSYPASFTAMTYTLSPEPSEDIFIYDCAEGDTPLTRPQGAASFTAEAPHDIACVGIIGGADGPTAIILDGPSQEGSYNACSALRFTPTPEDIEWRVEFSMKPWPKTLTLPLLPQIPA